MIHLESFEKKLNCILFSAVKIFEIFFVFLSTFISLISAADGGDLEHDSHCDNKCKSTSIIQIKPYIVILGPTDLMQVRVNLENYQPTEKEIKKFEINFGDGFIATNKTDIYLASLNLKNQIPLILE